MSEMIERVARAIYERNSKRTNYVWPDDVYPAIRNRCLRDARAAIEAMREPTEEMVRAGSIAIIEAEEAERKLMADMRARFGGMPALEDSRPSAVLRSMISAALRDSTG